MHLYSLAGVVILEIRGFSAGICGAHRVVVDSAKERGGPTSSYIAMEKRNLGGVYVFVLLTAYSLARWLRLTSTLVLHMPWHPQRALGQLNLPVDMQRVYFLRD